MSKLLGQNVNINFEINICNPFKFYLCFPAIPSIDRLCKPTISAQNRNSKKSDEPAADEGNVEKKNNNKPKPASKSILKKPRPKPKHTQSSAKPNNNSNAAKNTEQYKRTKGRVIIRRDGFEYSSEDDSYSSDESGEKTGRSEVSRKAHHKTTKSIKKVEKEPPKRRKENRSEGNVQKNDVLVISN